MDKDLIEFVDGSAGSAPLRRGARWADGPTLPGRGKTVWVLPEDAERTFSACLPVLLVSKRHRCRGGRGRWVDPGEVYTDSDVARAVARAGVSRGRGWDRWLGPVEPLPLDVYNGLSGR